MQKYEWPIMLAAALITTLVWIIVTLLTKPTQRSVLYEFYKKVQPGGPGWNHVKNSAKAENIDIVSEEGWDVPTGILCTLLGSVAVYTALFATGNFLYSQTQSGLINLAICVVSLVLTVRLWKTLKIV